MSHAVRAWSIRVAPVVALLAALARSQTATCEECPGFSLAVDYATGPATFGVAVGDLNRDGRPDLAVATSSGVSILLANGPGTFAPAVTYAAGAGPTAVAIHDFNGDGK